jgi:hypothetical protein
MHGHNHESTSPMLSADKWKKSTKQAFPLYKQLTGEINWLTNSQNILPIL